MSFAAVEEIFELWDRLGEESRALYEQAIEIVTNKEASEKDARVLKDLFVRNPNLDVNFAGLNPIYGNTLLFEAVSRGHVALVETLMELGADPRAENQMDGETPLEYLEDCDDDDDDKPENIQTIHHMLLNNGEKLAKQQCANCGETEKTKLSLCSTCKTVRYCSKECQKSHWKEHKRTCKVTDNSPEAMLKEHEHNMWWALGEDPDEIHQLREDCRRNPLDVMSRMFLQSRIEQAKEMQSEISADEIEFLAYRNKTKKMAERLHAKLPPRQSKLVKEAFYISKMTEDEEWHCESGAKLLARLKEIYTEPGMDVNTPSPTGDILLTEIVENSVLEEKEDDAKAQVEIVRFLLEQGADPNLENTLENTALDHADAIYKFETMTPQQSEIVHLLEAAGGLFRGVDADAQCYMKRGEGEGEIQKARREKEEVMKVAAVAAGQGSSTLE